MNNSELLFLYDAKLCNPNGDPDDENRPRMDYERGINLVSDVRLKRYIRDFLLDHGHEIYISRVDGATVNATGRLEHALGKNKIGREDLPEILSKLVDIRLFGATMPVKGASISLTGPIQFNWGHSLNKVTLLDSVSITSRFSSDSGKEQGTIGKDYRLYFSLVAFHGVVSAKRAEITMMTEDDLALFDSALVKAIPLMATRSKVGQYPRLYMRVEYINNETFIGDWRDYIKLDNDAGSLRDISEVVLKVDQLIDCLIKQKDKIAKIVLWQDAKLLLSAGENTGTLADLLPVDVRDKLVMLES